MDSIGRLAAPAPSATGASIDPSAIDVLRQLRRPDKPDPVIELIDMFVRDTPERLHKLRTAVAQYNAEDLAAVAHNLRGCASSIGATQLASLCEKLEQNAEAGQLGRSEDRKSTRLNSSHANISYAVFCLK